MKRSLIIAAGVIALGAGGVLSMFAAAPPGAPSAVIAPTLLTTSFSIENMTCALCPVTVKKAMLGVAGVHSVAVDFDTKTAKVMFDPSRTSVVAIAQASTGAGYPASEKRLTR